MDGLCANTVHYNADIENNKAQLPFSETLMYVSKEEYVSQLDTQLVESQSDAQLVESQSDAQLAESQSYGQLVESQADAQIGGELASSPMEGRYMYI